MKFALLQFVRSSWRVAAATLVSACLAAACGGGVDSGGTGAPAQTFSAGRIAGFGSVIVNGVHFDETNASIVDDDGVSHGRSDLKLGMLVAIDAGPISVDASTGLSTAVASRVQFGSAIAGPVQAIDSVGSVLTVIGQPVKINAATVFAGISDGIAGVHAGDLLEVNALLDTSSGVYTATRVELKSNLPAYRLRGVVSRLDTAAQTFSIGGADISYAGVPAASLPTLVNGTLVNLRLQTQQQAGLWILAKGTLASNHIANAANTAVEGIVSNFTGLGSFMLDGTLVDASGSGVVFRRGSPNQIANGVRLEVEGVMNNGVVQATTVEIRQADADNQGIDLHGLIESADAARMSFVLRGNTVVYDAGTRFVRGSAADLVAGAEVDVKGRLTNHGTQVYATMIRLGK
ncbi:MAG TPA: DUF5666 domain-containing protein [Albitalea sp.]|nr:DUF5666 domain-containing protein [Albitalea sp.]